MVYLKGVFFITIFLIASIAICAGSTKIAYKKSIYGKSNVLKEKRMQQKAAISPKGQNLDNIARSSTATPPAMRTTTASAMTTTLVEPTTGTMNNCSTIALTTNAPTSTTAPTTIIQTTPANVDISGEQQTEQVSNNNTKYNNKDIQVAQINGGGTNDDNVVSIPLPPLSLYPTNEEKVSAELKTISELEAAADELVGANSQAIAVVQPARLSANIAHTANKLPETNKRNQLVPCTCGVFLNSQFKRGSSEQPTGNAVIVNELERNYQCNAIGQKQCQTKCLEIIVQHLPNSANILCATLDRDCRKERAYLFIKNCRNKWINTNLAAGREYCCKNGQSYQCPLV